MVHDNVMKLRESMKNAGFSVDGDSVQLDKSSAVKPVSIVDELIWTAVFSKDETAKTAARQAIHDLAWHTGAIPSSIMPLYDAIGRGELKPTFTVPAHNIRALTYDVCRALFRAAMKLDVGAFIFEIARSEIGYTEQRPGEYAACVLAAAVKEGYRGPVFIQGDHFQFSAKKYKSDEREAERKAIEGLIDEAIAAEFYNIDIDTSTLVDLSFPTIDEQQSPNYENTAHFTRYIRAHQPEGIDISIGGEIGEVGHTNTTPEEFRAYMSGFQKLAGDIKGISKVSIQTGTSHGGVPLADGSIADVSIDFDAIREITRIARTEYKVSGAVQHGASTLPEEVFDNFPKNDTVEIHLATGFQNMTLDHANFPADLKQSMIDWIWKTSASEKKEKETNDQFVYKTRKKTLGPFKRQMWEMPAENKQAIVDSLEAKFTFLFQKLGVAGTKDTVSKFIKPDASKRPKTRQMSTGGAMAFVNEGEGE